MAFLKVSLAGALTAMGGVVGYFLVAQLGLFTLLSGCRIQQFFVCRIGRPDPSIAKKAVSSRDRSADYLAGDWHGDGDAGQ